MRSPIPSRKQVGIRRRPPLSWARPIHPPGARPMRRFLSLLIGLAVALPAAAGERKPNILVIVSDDQGYADAGFQGSKEIPTPHLDALARSGARCTAGYVSGPYCSPTRAGL